MSDIEADECIDKEGTSVASSAERVSSNEDAYAWADDPVADREWIARYEEDMKQRKVFEGKMSKHLDGSTKLKQWCACGYCSLDHLNNWQECHCCSELDGCNEAMASDIVTQELDGTENITCITQHPGFRPVCLERWSLRMASWQYKTKGKQRYKQDADEESKVTSKLPLNRLHPLIVDLLLDGGGGKPCAYQIIRTKFSSGKDEVFTGFEMDDDDM